MSGRLRSGWGDHAQLDDDLGGLSLDARREMLKLPDEELHHGRGDLGGVRPLKLETDDPAMHRQLLA